MECHRGRPGSRWKSSCLVATAITASPEAITTAGAGPWYWVMCPRPRCPPCGVDTVSTCTWTRDVCCTSSLKRCRRRWRTSFCRWPTGCAGFRTDGGARIGSTVAILGPGHEGMACIVAAKEAGASCVIVTGLAADAGRLATARELGADYTINIEAEDAVQRVREITSGGMADTVVNVTASAPEAVEQAIEIVGRRGTIVQAGVARSPAEISIDTVLRKEVTLKGTRAHLMADLQKGIQVLESGKYPLEIICTHQFPIEETEQAIKTVGREGDLESLAVAVVAT